MLRMLNLREHASIVHASKECGMGRLRFTPSDDGLARRILSNVLPGCLAGQYWPAVWLHDIVHGKGERWVELTLRQSRGFQGP